MILPGRVSCHVNVSAPTTDLPRSMNAAHGEVMETTVFVDAFFAFCTLHELRWPAE